MRASGGFAAIMIAAVLVVACGGGGSTATPAPAGEAAVDAVLTWGEQRGWPAAQFPTLWTAGHPVEGEDEWRGYAGFARPQDLALALEWTDLWGDLAQRPLAIPQLAPGDPCPAATGKEVFEAFGPAAGEGPVYPVLGSRGVMPLGGGRVEGGWEYAKVLWVVNSEYGGPALIRGGQLDGPNELRFNRGPDPAAVMLIPPSTAKDDTPQWRDFPSFTRLRAPGCYAYQVDGLDFSLVIVFEAKTG